MSASRRLFKNTATLIVANGLQPLLSFYLVITIARRLGVDGLGAYSTVFNYQAIFQILAGFGLKNLLTRDLAQKPGETGRYLLHGSLVTLPFSILSMAAMIALMMLLGYEESLFEASVILSLSLLAAGLIDVCEGVVAGAQRLDFVGYTALVENFLRVIISLACLWQGMGLLALVWIFTALRFARVVLYLIFIFRQFAPLQFKRDLAFAKNLARNARVFAATMACVTIYWKVDVSLLSQFGSMEDVGIYTAAYRFFMLSMVLVDSFVNSLFPLIANFFQACGEAFEHACKKSLQVLLVVTVPITLAFSLFAEPIILLVYKAKLAAAIPVLRWLIWALIPYAISQILAYALVASNNQRYDFFVNAASMVANIILNWFLIQRYGYMGAVWAALIAICIYVVLQLPFVLTRVLRFQWKTLAAGVFKVAGAATAMAAFISLFKSITFWGALPLAFVIYLTALLALRFFSRSDLAILYRVLGKAK
jgi:O-antigen/teichoic acid export membrane protein